VGHLRGRASAHARQQAGRTDGFCGSPQVVSLVWEPDFRGLQRRGRMKSAQRLRIVGLRQSPFLPAWTNDQDVGPALRNGVIENSALFARVALDRFQPPRVDFVITAK